TRILDQNGETVLWRFENPTIDYRQNIRLTDGSTLFYTDIPEELVTATLAALDPDYFLQPDDFLRNMIGSRSDPIINQLVTELLLWDELDHPYRQNRINLLANQIIAKYGRLKVLEWYFNSAYYGNGIYGVNQAAKFYFGMPVDTLDLAESALLAAVAKFPSLNPYDAPTAAKENQEKIIDEMLSAELITDQKANSAKQKELIYADQGLAINPPIPAFVKYILEEASSLIPPDRLLRGGFNIISSLDSDLQDELVCASSTMLNRVYGKDPHLDETCNAARLLPRYSGSILENDRNLEIDLVLLDPVDGRVLAMVETSNTVGSGSMFEPKLAGSLITPFIYLNSFRQGFDPASLVWDIPLAEEIISIEELHPGGNREDVFLGPVNMRSALVNDYLSPAIQLWDSHGSQQIENTMALFGISIPVENCLDCTYFKGSSRIELIDISQGYGVFANQGVLRGKPDKVSGLGVHPTAILRIEDTFGFTWLDINQPVEKKVISEQLTFLVNNVLSDEDTRANTIENDLFLIGRPAGIKVGNVANSSSGWVIGYTPQIVTTVWTGLLDEESGLSQSDFQQINSGIWRAITQYAARELPVEEWQISEGILTLDVCYPSGMLPTEYCPKIVREIFIQGNEPQQTDALYQAMEVNRETGLLASVFTSAGEIEKKVFLVIPPEALDWAENSNVPTPPVVYDLENIEKIEELSISFPDNFAFAHGRVGIIGSIPEDEFVSARIQYGKGMNPTSWLQIGPEILSPANNTRLGIWDTENLEDGLYALQWVVIRDQQQVEKTSLVVSVDNTPPEISLRSDLDGKSISYEVGKELLFEVEFVNENEIQLVEFTINSKNQLSRDLPPFVYPWLMTVGEFELRIKAVDHANNQSVIRINFEVVKD
ncbi:MAG: transglycosylase domain-containing protein, partial [Anaerolineales bacterium]|nr:transglycosylase domain-containing protein [Anaerolineales bacterium]